MTQGPAIMNGRPPPARCAYSDRSARRLCHPKWLVRALPANVERALSTLRLLENSGQVSKSWHRRCPSEVRSSRTSCCSAGTSSRTGRPVRAALRSQIRPSAAAPGTPSRTGGPVPPARAALRPQIQSRRPPPFFAPEHPEQDLLRAGVRFPEIRLLQRPAARRLDDERRQICVLLPARPPGL